MRYGGKIAVVVYLAFLAVFVFWVLDKQVLYGSQTGDKGEPLPIWLGLVFYAPLAVAVVAIGIGLRRLREGRPA